MQKLEERNTYTPTNIPQVRGNCGLRLNREETLSVSGLKTSSNNSDAALTGFEKFQNGTYKYLLQKLLLYSRKEHDYQLSLKLITFTALIPQLKLWVSEPDR